ncbi:MAG TPA: ABC transporter transmembrane domain-containing protein, partial [Saprospiraceae bacterium]|nr:ABC transporter transmembrane domain-containing protein [Saprospiraceae bacterium]
MAEQKQPKSLMVPLRRFFSLLKMDQKDITYIYIYAIFSGLITLSIPLGIQAIIGLIAGGAMSSSLYILIAIVTIGTGMIGVLKIMQMTVTETLQRRIFCRSAFEFAYRIPHFKLDSIQKTYPPELVNRFFDTPTLQKGLPKILMDFSTAILQIVFGLILISFYHPFFVFFGVLLVVIVFFIFRITGPPGLSTSLRESDYKYEVAHWLEELARATSSFKLSGKNNFALKKTDEIVSKYLDVRKKHFRILLIQFGGVVGFKVIVTAALLFLGSLLVIENEINIGQFVAAEIVVILIMSSVEKLILNMETIYDMLTGIEKIGKVSDQPLDRASGVDFDEIDSGKGMAV